MAVDSWATPPSPPSAADQAAADEAGAAARKVKLLCSFAGRILPRPSDGVLRYVGGHTRIISLHKDVTFPELAARMADVAGGPAALKYQLPDEDLDALVSVSCPEDLDNMMEEYDKLTDTSPDGSAKLRAFLFPAPDPGLEFADDTGHRYLDAVNGIDPPVLKRKDSASSYTSDDAADSAAAASATGGTPSTLDAMLMPRNASKLNLAGGTNPAVGFPDAPLMALNASSYVPPLPAAYMDPSHIPCMNPQQLGIVGRTSPANPPINPQPFVSVHPNVPPVHATTASAVSVVSNSVKPIQSSYLEGYVHEARAPQSPVDQNYNLEGITYGVRTVQPPMDQNYKLHQPLSQLPPLQPFHLQPQNVDWYDLHQMLKPPQELQQGQTLRLEDCHLCQKALPHNHSDTLIQEHGNGSAGSSQEVSPVYYSHHSEDVAGQRGQHTVVMAGAMADSIVEPKVESSIPTNQLGSYGLVQVPGAQYGGDRQAKLKAENFGHATVLVPHGGIRFPGDAPTSYAMLSANLPHIHLEDPLKLQQQQQQQVRQNVVQTQYPVPIRADVSTSGNTDDQMAELVPGFSYDYVRPIDRMMESLRVNPPEASRLDEQGMPIVQPNVGTPTNLKPDTSPMVLVNGYVPRSQVGGNAMYVANNAFINSGMVSEGNSVRAVDQLPPTSLDVSHLHNLQSPDTNQISQMTGNMRPHLHNLERDLEPPIPNERLLGVPTYSRGFDAYSNHNVVTKIPAKDWKDEASQFHSKNVPASIAPPPSSNFPASAMNSNRPTGHPENFQEPLPSNSLFSDQDAWKIIGGANLLPPKPHRVASKEPVISNGSGIVNHVEHSNGSNLAKMLEDGGLQQPLNSLNKNGLEAGRPTKNSAEERIKQDLQAVAEGVAISVLESSTPPVPVFYARERKEPPAEFNKEREIIEENADAQNAAAIIDDGIEDKKNMQLEKVNLGFPVTEDIGRLQIIKNSDLEELRELGSGTFGTVYHGKWRGTDVAIKRINDRCFAGKPSEQERARSDFWNEACKLADLHHPNVVAFYGVVLDGPGGSIATVTEFMVNGSLRHALQKNDKKLDLRKRLLIAMDVAFGMEYLHGKNIVHFDLKSDNLLVNLRDPQRPICKVGDLGLSKVKCQTLISGGVRGTLPWMAPELLNGSSSLVSDKVDVFSFGIVMWELLTGEEPYADLHYGVIIGGIVSNTLRPPVPHSCDPEWRLLMEQCWSAEPSERPSFTEIANRLRSMAAALPQKGPAAAHQAAQPQAEK